MYSTSVSNYLPIQLYSVSGVHIGYLYAGSQNQPLLVLNGLPGVSVVLQDRLSYQYLSTVYQGTKKIGDVKFNQSGQLILYP